MLILVIVWLNLLFIFAGDLQEVKDVLLFSNHCDPQLKGNTAVLIGQFICAVLIQSRGCFDDWIEKYSKKGNKHKHLCTVLI